MKFTRVLTLALVALLAMFTLASCGDMTAPEITVTLKIIADNAEEPILNAEVKIQENNPTVLSVFREGCIVNDINYELTEDEASVLDIDEYKDYTESDTGIAHYWMYYINDVEPLSGKANANAVADGDVITYTYVAYDPNEG